MNNLQAMTKALIPVDEWRNYLAFFFHILAAPVERTMAIVNDPQQTSVDPFKFMAFGFSMLTIVSVGAPLGDEKLELAVSLFRLISVVIATITSLLVTYQVFRRYTNTERTLDSFLVLSAIYSGVFWILSGVNTVISVFLGESTAGFTGLAIVIFTAIFSIRLYRQFWGLPVKKIFQYLIYAAVLGFIVIFIEVLILSAIMGVAITSTT